MIKEFYKHLGLTFVRQESGKNGPELIFECPWCSSKSLSVNAGTGAYQCFKGCGNGYPYQIARDIANLEPKAIFELLERFGLGNDSPTAARMQAQAPKPTKPKLGKNDVMPLSDEDIATFCAVKGIDREAFLKLKPLRHKHKPLVLLPAFDPDDMKHACGWIRASIDGSPVIIKYKDDEGIWQEKGEKYPVIKGSNVGLLGLHALKAYKTIIFAEGWKDAVAAISHGYAAVACSSGAGKWRDSWSTVFAGKTVYVIFDCDAAGVKGAEKVAEKIDEVAKWVGVVELPFKYREKGGLDLHDYLTGVKE